MTQTGHKKNKKRVWRCLRSTEFISPSSGAHLCTLPHKQEPKGKRSKNKMNTFAIKRIKRALKWNCRLVLAEHSRGGKGFNEWMPANDPLAPPWPNWLTKLNALVVSINECTHVTYPPKNQEVYCLRPLLNITIQKCFEWFEFKKNPSRELPRRTVRNWAVTVALLPKNLLYSIKARVYFKFLNQGIGSRTSGFGPF